MNFFEHQDEARRKTGRLVVLFFLAVAAITVAVYFILLFAFDLGTRSTDRYIDEEIATHAARDSFYYKVDEFWNPALLGLTAAGVGIVVTAGSLYRIATLGSGGKGIAELLGGRLLSSSTTDPRERRLLNVVEEMALASGMPVPPVYLMDHETVVNAFAAGFTPADAVIGVTRGTMEMLTRDELQGVIAHEFSHIFNGDMRLNVRLIGVLHGILLISLIGYLMFRIAASVRPSRSSSNKKDASGGIILVMLAVGASLYVLGYIGVFFGHLIKSAVSRQREFLADASAVQFTRHPEGISGALKKIGALGSRLRTSQAEQASHMFFGNGVKEAWFNLTATHPPLVDRIRRIEPNFNGDYSRERLRWPDATAELNDAAAPPSASPAGPRRAAMLAAAGVANLSADVALADVGTPQAQHLDFASRLLAELPPALRDETHDPVGAACVIFALLLHADPSEDEPELQRLARTISSEIAERVRRDVSLVTGISVAERLPLAQLTMSALRQLTPPQYELFHRAVVDLIRADRQVSLFEYGVHRLVIRRLNDFFSAAPPVVVRHTTLDAVGDAAMTLFAVLAYFGNTDDPQAETAALAAGSRTIGLPTASRSERPGFQAVDDALDKLAASSGAVKQRVLEGCAAVIGHDGRLTVDEAELLRTVADALDCPMPPPLART